MATKALVLSIFPGIDLLGRAFEEEGYCVVRGPDLLWGGDVRSFHPPANVFEGVIGGPPCQAFSPLRHMVRQRHGEGKIAPNLIPEFERVVGEVRSAWFVMENSRYAPAPSVAGYLVHSQMLDNRWLGERQRRQRLIAFGTTDGRRLLIDIAPLEHPITEMAVTRENRAYCIKMGGSGKVKPEWAANRVRTIEEALQLQGFPPNLLDDAPFTAEAKRQVVANGVPLPMGRAIARAVRRATQEA